VKKRGNGEDDPKPPAKAASTADESGAGEASGLQGVDAAPREPLTREQIEELRRERDELQDQLLRRRAEFDNYRKRVERDRQQAGTDSAAALLKSLIPTVDNLDRALDAPGGEGLREGVELIRRDLLALLESQGVVREDPKGERFDPERHQALVHEAAPGHDEGTVTEVFGKGYRFKDRLLRPALVKVAKGEDGDDSGGGRGAIH
jgi:molecular chaperone GrpE